MRVATYFSVLATALSASAFTVLVPSNSSSWASTGSNTLSWQRVSTDANNFTVYLTNEDRSVLPDNNQLLAAFVDATSATSISIDAPSGGFNVGGHYRVNLVQSQDDPAIYAQSEEFEIVAGPSSATDSTASSGSSATSASASTTGSATRTSASGSSSNTATATDDSATSSGADPSSTANSAGSRKMEFGLLGALLLLGGVVA